MSHKLRFPLALAALFAPALAWSTVQAQNDPEKVDRLRQEQQEVLRKAERLQALMERLQQRYVREGKKEQVDLLAAGIAHLENSGMLRDVAGIRDDLSATALSEALRKQKKVVDDLEQLLNILLDRRSVESLAEQQKLASERAATARQLEQRQRQLQQQANEALQQAPSPTERALLEQLQNLANAERAEADRNARESGTRRPFLESALQRVEQLLQQEERLEAAVGEEKGAGQTATRQREFDLGELVQQTRQLASELRGQTRQDELAKAAETMAQEAAGNDQQALQQAKNRLEALAQDAPKVPGNSTEGDSTDKKWQELAEALRNAPPGDNPAEREALEKLATAGAELAKQRGTESAERNGDRGEKLAAGARTLAEKLGAEGGKPAGAEPAEPAEPKPGEQSPSPAKSLEQAAKALDEAKAAAREGKSRDAQRQVDQALTALEKARAEFQQEHPDAEKQAGAMAAEAAAAAQELANAPNAQEAEQQAAKQLEQAGEALRALEDEVSKARDGNRRPDAAATSEKSRQKLEEAKSTLEKALGDATEGREKEMQAAAARQQELAKQAEQAQAAMQRGAETGELTPEQAKQAQKSMQQAKQSMQQAAERLQKGQQAGAAADQQQAADALAEAGQQLQENKPVTEQQKENLKQQAEQQQQLTEDIVKLARLLEQRDQEAARRKLDEAADAARKAERAMQEGDAEETRDQQEEARQKLDEAAQELEEERDRYQDLRQEELLFKMKEELLAFLERQRPITAATLAAQQSADAGSLSRPARHKLNQLAEEELELSGRIDFLIKALEEEGNLVYQTVLRANLEDLKDIAARLGGRAPDPGTFTTLMQQDVERRSEELLVALENERRRREQQRKEQQKQQQQGQQGENKFNPQRERLVGLIAELEMLKKLLEDTGRATDNMHTLISSRGDESINETEAALVERLAHRHSEITKLFLQIKAAVEETLKAMQGQQGGDEGGGGGKGK